MSICGTVSTPGTETGGRQCLRVTAGEGNSHPCGVGYMEQVGRGSQKP